MRRSSRPYSGACLGTTPSLHPERILPSASVPDARHFVIVELFRRHNRDSCCYSAVCRAAARLLLAANATVSGAENFDEKCAGRATRTPTDPKRQTGLIA